MFRSLLVNSLPHCTNGGLRERREFVQGHRANNHQVRAKARSPDSKSFYPLIRLKLRLVKYCTKVYANRRNHSYPSLLYQESTSTCHIWTQLFLPSRYPFHSRKERPSSALHLPLALTIKKGPPPPSVHRMAIKARRSFKYLTPKVILRPKVDISYLLKSTQGL